MDDATLDRLYTHPAPGRPWVRVNFVASVDGSAQDGEGVSGSLGGEADLAAFRAMRRAADVVLVTAGTARAEDYGPATDAVLAIVSNSLAVPARVRQPGTVVLTSAAADPEEIAALEADGVEVLIVGDTDLDWSTVLATFAERGLHRVLCEGGPSLFAQLAEADVVDEVCLTIAPVLLLGSGQRIAHGSTSSARQLRLAHAEAVGDVLLTRWERAR